MEDDGPRDAAPAETRWRTLPEPVRWADTTTTQPVGSALLAVGCAGVPADGAVAVPDDGE